MSSLKRSPMPSRAKPLARGGRIKARNPKRKAKNRARAYGSPDRIAFVQSLPCLVCGHRPSEAAHVGNGGMSRKADADQIVPLCGPRMELTRTTIAIVEGHHAESHRVGLRTFQAKHGVTLKDAAAKVEERWQQHLAQSHPTTNPS